MSRLTYLQRMRERHGDVFTVRPIDGTPSVIVSDPELIRQIVTAPPDVLHAGECNRQALGWLLGKHSLLVLDGEPHLTHRRFMLPSFHADRLRRWADGMRSIAETHLADWPTGETISTLERLRRLTLDVVLQASFGSCEHGVGRMLRDNLPARLLMANTGDAGDSNASAFAASVEKAKATIGNAVTARRTEARLGQHDDVLSDLLAAQDENGSRLSDEEIRDELLTLIVAGTGTTANSLAWVLERLARAPGPLARASAEAASDGTYIDAVVRETLRMRPVVPILARLAKQPFSMGEHSVKPGTLVAPCPLLVHHRPDIYPEPMSFRPERFLEEHPGTYTWIPFGGGMRRCIGNGFALLEMRTVIAVLLSHMTPRAVRDEQEKMLQLGNGMVPADGSSLVLEPIDGRRFSKIRRCGTGTT